MFAQILVNSLVAGSIYALIASGFSIIYTTNRFVHFAHGSTATIAAYLFYWQLTGLNLPIGLAIVLTILASGFVGFLYFLLIYSPLKKRGASSSILLIASVGIMFFCDNLMRFIFGSDVKIIPLFIYQKGIEIAGGIITPLQIVLLLTAIVLFVCLWLFSRFSFLGKTMRAVADNPELAKTSGINSTAIQYYSFIIGSAIAGLAGILIALERNIEPTMGVLLSIQGFTASVIGGVASIPGSIIGAYLLGSAENFGTWFLPSGYKCAISFVLLVVFLLLRPQGIFGVDKGLKDQKM